MVFLFSDLVGSVALKTRYGDEAAARVIARHDELFRIAVEPQGEILKDTGDGFLAQFNTTREAVQAALRFQYLMAKEEWENKIPVFARVGVHLGEASEIDEDPAGGPKVTGLAVDFTSRVMDLAVPGQILLTRAAFDGARQYVREHPSVEGYIGKGAAEPPVLKWMAHGPYLFKGSDDPLEIFEVGGMGIAPLTVPPDSAKARRAVAADDEETLGWRPAGGLTVPGRRGWVLDHRIGEGGFGEVWLAVHEQTGTKRVFKFCYDAERLRSFKRELALVRLLRENLGERPDIAKLYEVQVEEPPFFLESEFTEQGDLVDWAQAQGGIDQVPLSTRLDIVARTAEAAAAAHSVGVLHKDIKPSNVLIYLDEEKQPRPRLADFGIGRLTNKQELQDIGLKIASTESALIDEGDTQSGTAMYAPPETLIGRPFTIHGDVYALGVMLYQMVVGDLERPLGQGWERDVTYPLLRRDIADCVAGDENMRLDTARELAERLSTLPQRRRHERRRHIARLAGAAVVLLTVLLTVAGVVIVREVRLRQQAQEAEKRTSAINDFLVQKVFMAADPTLEGREAVAGREVRVAAVLDHAFVEAQVASQEQPDIMAEVIRTISMTYKNLGLYNDAESAARAALALRQGIYEFDHPEIAESLQDVADVLWHAGRVEDARILYEQALEMRRRLFDEESPEVARSLNSLAAGLYALQEYEQAEAMFRSVLRIRRTLLESDPESIEPMLVAASENNLATCLRESGQLDEALQRFQTALAMAVELLGLEHPYVGTTHHNIGLTLARQNKYDQAAVQYGKALRIKQLKYGPEHPKVAGTLLALAELELERGDLEAAQLRCDEALQIREFYPVGHPEVADVLHVLGQVHLSRNDQIAAEAPLQEARQLRVTHHPQTVVEIAEIENDLGACLLGQGDYEQAELLLLTSLDVLQAEYGTEHERTGRAINRMVAYYEATGDQAKVKQYRKMLQGKRQPSVEG
jgi:serine/threonine-protein kinase